MTSLALWTRYNWSTSIKSVKSVASSLRRTALVTCWVLQCFWLRLTESKSCIQVTIQERKIGIWNRLKFRQAAKLTCLLSKVHMGLKNMKIGKTAKQSSNSWYMTSWGEAANVWCPALPWVELRSSFWSLMNTGESILSFSRCLLCTREIWLKSL